jgi:hypothetical protein
VHLGNDAPDAASLHHGGAIVQIVLDVERQSHDQDAVQILRFFRHQGQRFQHRLLQLLGKEQIPAGIAAQG